MRLLITEIYNACNPSACKCYLFASTMDDTNEDWTHYCRRTRQVRCQRVIEVNTTVKNLELLNPPHNNYRLSFKHSENSKTRNRGLSFVYCSYCKCLTSSIGLLILICSLISINITHFITNYFENSKHLSMDHNFSGKTCSSFLDKWICATRIN